MPFDLWVSFTIAAAVLAVAPGPDNLFVLLQSAMYGARAGIFVTLGLCVGVFIQTLLAAFGVAAVVAASPTLLMIIQFAGAAYLLYLAWGAWNAPVGGESGESSKKYPRLTNFQLWRRGILMNITNPKVLIFFLAFFPQFIIKGSTESQVMVQMLIMGMTFLVCTLVVFSAIAWCAGTLADRLRSPKVQTILNKVSAVIFTVLAISTLLWKAN
ncbi:LysE family translocator [Parasutterella secunda]|uniref:LysE family translocator n=1 Tax=Parasutterella secunda TaxID=626947 RepID=UPI0025A4A4C8|nr:LysE family translocator [Parasutterella secunda]MDM8086862.1 LysE family translocator [Parasutterella secunda]MDM8218453.1 LysE family translocator [Parasutterella secunda]MDM8226521.1 LysE family translocator [Parasutterella secunda]